MELSEHRVGERRESPDCVGQRRGEIRAIEVDAISERGFDRFGQSGLAQPRSQGAWWAPWRVVRIRRWVDSEGSVLVDVGDEFSQSVRCRAPLPDLERSIAGCRLSE